MEVLTIISLASSFAIALVAGWAVKNYLQIKQQYIFSDLALVALFIWLILARIQGLIMNWNEISKNWSLLPIVETDFGLEYFSEWPWVFFNFLDGNFWLLSGVVAMLVGLYFGKSFFRKNNSYEFIQFGSLVVLVSFLPIQLSAWISGHLDVNYLIELQPVFLFTYLSLFVLIGFLSKTELLIKLAFILALSLEIFFLWQFSTELGSSDLVLIVGRILIILGLIYEIFRQILGQDKMSISREELPNLSKDRSLRARNFSSWRNK